ncbi:MAG TPA: glucose-1-phosphate thymidylyltransferase [Trueperaceae bacterium]|nr:glucose-1-phosphate thymidylyltransferase [Trueperaceae bacterium]
MKGLILAAGLGTRLRPLTSLRPKPTIAVANKPLIHYAVDNLVDAGIDHIGVVVGPSTVTPIKETLEGYRGARFEYVMQDPPLGLAHAVKVARPFLGDDPFVMYLSDNLFERGVSDFVARFDPDGGVNAVLALVEVPDPRQLGVAVVTDGRIERLVEKPADPPSNLAVAGVYVFDATVHEAIEGLRPGAKGEYQITDAIQRMIDAGRTVAPVVVPGWWKDTGKAEDILDANRLVLGRLRGRVEGTVEDSELVGEVVVEAGAVVRGSTVFGPAIVGANATVERAYVGPFTTIGDDVTVRDAELEYTVVGARTLIERVGTRIQASLLGEDVILTGHDGRPSSHRLIVGDESRIELREM